MAARTLFQKRALAPLGAAVLGGLALAPATVFAESPNEHKRKSIYDEIEASPSQPSGLTLSLPKILSSDSRTDNDEAAHKPSGPTPTDRLAVQIGHTRLFLHKYAAAMEDKLNESVDSAFHLEQSFTNTIASLAPPRESGEKLIPGSIYVLVAAMAGSIITRNRNILLRASMPLALGIGAGWMVLPVTMRNCSELAWTYEKRFPAVANAHLSVRESVEKSVSFAKAHGQVGVRYVDEKVTDAREAVEGWVKEGK